MSNIFIKNQQTNANRGTGLAAYDNTNKQYRFQERADYSPLGYWEVPNNKLPTFQFWFENDIDTLELIPVKGTKDQAPIPLDLGLLDKRCLDNSEGFIYSYLDTVSLPFSIPCGAYYLRAYDSVDPTNADLYSEVFRVGKFGADMIAEIDTLVGSSVVFQLRTDLVVQTFQYLFTAPLGTGIAVPVPAPYSGTIGFTFNPLDVSDLTFTLNAKVADSSTTIQTFVFKYRVSVSGGGVLSIIPLYT